jgi:CRP-like cAMP-binding protein
MKYEMKESKNLCGLESCFVCRLCTPEWRPAVAAHKKNYIVKKSQMVFREGDPVNGIYFVTKGKVKVHKRWDDEKEVIIRFAQQGDILGHLGLGDTPFYPMSATALEEVELCYLEMPFFRSTLSFNFNVVNELLRFFANEAKESERRMRNLVHMTVKARIAQSFIALKKQFGTDDEGYIAIELSRQDLASFSGSSYETLFKVITELTLQKIIVFSGRKVKLIKEKKLLELVDANNG